MGIKVWEGAGFDGSPIALYMACVDRPSTNSKTGKMVQTLIMRTDIDPFQAVKTGQDAAVCGTCLVRGGNGCYVHVSRAPLTVWNTTPGEVRYIGEVELDGKLVRLGMYGDPAAVPVPIWRRVLKRAAGWTGYTHQWARAHRAYASLVMASVESAAGREEAKARGYRTFRMLRSVDELAPGEILCPASEEAGKRTQCAKCKLCDGRRGPDDRRKDIAIVAHGRNFRRAMAAIEQAGQEN